MTTDCQFSATICPDCDGYGLTTELYNFRRLERTCATCCSHVVILNEDTQKNSCLAKEPSSTRKNDWVETEKKRYKNFRQTKVQSAIQKLNNRLQNYQLELDAINEDSNEQDHDIVELRLNLKKQIENHINHLQQIKDQKLKELSSPLGG